MSDHFTYRSVSSGDLEQLKALAMASYGAYAPLLTSADAEKLKANMSNNEMWLQLLSVADSQVCLHDNKLIGMVFFIPSGNAWDVFQAEWAYIRLLGIDPAYKGQGIATALTKWCMERAVARQEKTLALHTSEIMPAARHIYERLGFTILREIEPRLGKRYWLYTRNLNPNT